MDLFGRKKILIPYQEITTGNVIEVMNQVLKVHAENYKEEDYLYWYRRGKQPILEKEKLVRPEINEKIVENHAAEIVAFKDGFFLSAPASYRTRKRSADANIVSKVLELNEYLYLSGKQDADNEVVDWFHTTGLGIIYIEPDPETYVSVCALDPRFAACAYYNTPRKTKALGFHISQGKDNAFYEVYTDKYKFTISLDRKIDSIYQGMFSIPSTARVKKEKNRIGLIPMVEYRYNSADMGSFEAAISLLDAINMVQSNRQDAIRQFVNSLLVFYNCTLGEDEDGQPITPEYIREVGAVFLKSIGENKADIKELSSQLNQTDQQVLIDYMYEQVRHIVGMPITNQGGTSASVTGTAILLSNGWEHADAAARNTEDLFKKSNREFDKIFLKILKSARQFEINPEDFELHFPRTETMNLLVKTQGALNMKQLGFSPEITFARAGLSNDPVTDVENSKPYIDRAWLGDNADVNEQPASEES